MTQADLLFLDGRLAQIEAAYKVADEALESMKPTMARLLYLLRLKCERDTK